MRARLPRQQSDWRLRHRIFGALSITILLSVTIAGIVVHSAGNDSSELVALRDFASDRFSVVWDDPARRADLVESIQRHFRVRVALRDRLGNVLYGRVDACTRHLQSLDVVRNGQIIGKIEGCVDAHGWPRSVVFGLLSLVLVLWAMSGLLARRLVRPLEAAVQVVRRIGDGQLDARVQLCSHFHHGEVGAVARAVNQMAEKIERQIAGQRELLAAVSHEIRSPLARLRMLVELERETQAGAAGVSPRLSSMDVELTELDSLVGQLLAQSRLEFQKVERRRIGAGELATMVLGRTSQPLEKLMLAAQDLSVEVDVTLFARALINLVDNAERHGGGLVELRVEPRDRVVRFSVRDNGEGFERQVEKQAFLPFVGSKGTSGLGLGLALVAQIARAHGTEVHLDSAPGKGATVAIDAPISTVD